MKVSVCIPTYNHAQYLVQAVQSVLNQSFPPSEIIISDDCSTDATPTVLQELWVKNPSIIKVIRQPVNVGIAQNTDRCLRAATGDYIVRLDSDDMLAPGYIQKLADALTRFPEAGYAHSAVQEINYQGELCKKRALARKPGYQTGADALRAAAKGYRVAANIIMFRREALLKVDFTSAKVDYVEDYYLSAAIAASGFGNVYVHDVLAYYRVWLDAGKVRQRRKLLEISGIRRVFEEVLEPAYRQQDWGEQKLKRCRKKFACAHADCLSWKVYTLSEKQEIKNELIKLSCSPLVKLHIWVYSNGCGLILNTLPKILSLPKSFIKMVYLRLVLPTLM